MTLDGAFQFLLGGAGVEVHFGVERVELEEVAMRLAPPAAVEACTLETNDLAEVGNPLLLSGGVGTQTLLLLNKRPSRRNRLKYAEVASGLSF